MHRPLSRFWLALPLVLLLQGCTASEPVHAVALVYGIISLISLLVLISYSCTVPQRDPWFFVLFFSVTVVNLGYHLLSVSQNLQMALFANRLSYLGSVFLPLSMWMIILRVTTISYRKWIPIVLSILSILVFLLAASPGILPLYYKEVSLVQVDGVSMLEKVYGPLHGLYLVYLLGYFAAMVTTIVYATLTDKIASTAYAVILAIAVFVNIAVWLAEQLIENNFEFLSVSYMISELFLLGLHLFILELEKQNKQSLPDSPQSARLPVAVVSPEAAQLFENGLKRLTPKEKALYDCYTNGMTTAQIMEQLNITENTLKFHNKNLYSKLGVSSRKQLLLIFRQRTPNE